MSRGTLELIVLGVVCSVAVLVIPVGQTVAATKKVTEPAPVVVAKPIKQSSEQGQTPSIQRAKKSPIAVTAERQPEAIQKQTKPAAVEPSPRTLRAPCLLPGNVHRRLLKSRLSLHRLNPSW